MTLLEIGITAVCWVIGFGILAKPPYGDYVLYWQLAQAQAEYAMQKVGL